MRLADLPDALLQPCVLLSYFGRFWLEDSYIGSEFAAEILEVCAVSGQRYRTSREMPELRPK